VREDTNRRKIEEFMTGLGRAVKSPARIYFTGGVTAVLLGWRDTTMDVDLKAIPEPVGFFEALPKLKESIDMNIELASPDDFVPALPGWEDRSTFISKEGPLSFFHYDFYGQAFSKIERLHKRDRLDIERMVSDGFVKPARLLELFLQVKDKLNHYPALEQSRLSLRMEQFARGEL
jgi:hypothetical protein